MQHITINGTSYPCRMTMGALRRFKQITGKGIEQIGADLDLLGVLLFSCIASACKADGIEFHDDVDTFLDKLDLDQVIAFSQGLQGDATGSKKKTPTM